LVRASADELFDYVDDYARLSSHMNRSTWMMGGGRMETEVDPGGGRRVGSRIRMSGRVFGLLLSLEEVVTERVPPRRKVWETIGRPRLLVIGNYRMGFEIEPQGTGSTLRVFIDYALPGTPAAWWLGRLFGRHYARWCTRRMVSDASRWFVESNHTRR
jgi:Polyketide cyclase / dehydrase and lipid transport